MKATDPRLVVLAARGDAGAFASLARDRWAGLVRLARSVVGEVEAEDAVQDALVAAWDKLASLRDPETFPRWLNRIVLRGCLRRARRRRPAVPLEQVPEPVRPDDPAARIDVVRLLGALAPRQRAVLHLTVIEGRTDGEIAGLLGITAASVRSHRRRARQRLTHLLDGAHRP